MSRDFIFRIKPGQPLPAKDPDGYRVLLDESTGQFKLLGSDGSINNLVVESTSTSTTTTVITDISSAQILNMGSTPIDLLPNVGVGMYYDIEKIIIEKDSFLTAYDIGTSEYVRIRNSGTGSFTAIENAILTNNSGQKTYIINNLDVYNADMSGTIIELNRSISNNSRYFLTTSDGSNPTLGDGTLRAIITYTIRTFGA